MRLAVTLVGVALLAGCATRPPVREPARPPMVVEPERPVATAADYMAVSASRSLLLVRAAELAERRAPTVATLARRIAANHRGIGAQLNLAGRRLDLLPSAELLPLDAAQLAALGRTGEPAVAFRRIVASAVANCLADAGDYAMRGTSPTLRPVARFAEAVCREEAALLSRG
ncbi:hypothetical protein GCM10022280_27020 [Sphingomonas swuensis]|uniref:DUF4142 domain-containing protein n=1 Tax=Sphingomonas swuensis TaxID=977800 RepID=A0ABP7TE47_9SPHN